MKDLIISGFTPISIITNFAEVKAEMVEGLKKYEIEVTQENLKAAKEMAADLNSLTKTISRTRIDKSKEFTGPISEFERQAKELETLAQSSRENDVKQGAEN